jgi:hypothetical protein
MIKYKGSIYWFIYYWIEIDICFPVIHSRYINKISCKLLFIISFRLIIEPIDIKLFRLIIIPNRSMVLIKLRRVNQLDFIIISTHSNLPLLLFLPIRNVFSLFCPHILIFISIHVFWTLPSPNNHVLISLF